MVELAVNGLGRIKNINKNAGTTGNNNSKMMTVS